MSVALLVKVATNFVGNVEGEESRHGFLGCGIDLRGFFLYKIELIGIDPRILLNRGVIGMLAPIRVKHMQNSY